MEQLLTVEETARQLGVSVSTLRHWINHGTAPPSGRFGKRRMFRVSDINRWVEAHFAQHHIEAVHTDESGTASISIEQGDLHEPRK